MEEQTVRVAAYVPKSLFESGDVLQTEDVSDCVVSAKISASDTAHGTDYLQIDWACLPEYVWVTLDVVGQLSLSVAASLLANAIFPHLTGHGEEPERRDVLLRFPSAEERVFDLTKPVDRKELEDLLEEEGIL